MKKTFPKMVDILRKADGLRIHLREYRTYFHIDQNYGISESSAYKAVK
ncbi:IS5 family transposase ISOt6 [Orientia tsutsugamushi]|nr:IS5 family transposase ISOt6 [Orientia tsutsugamushi]